MSSRETKTHFNEYPSISIITPVYNAGELLRETWDSLNKQTYQLFEWIIVDDGSDQVTKAIIREIADTWSGRVQVCLLKQGGACRARNRGLGKARGKYVKFLDADDLLEPKLLAIQNQLSIVNPSAVIAAPVKQVRKNNGELYEIQRNVLKKIPDDLFAAHMIAPTIHHSALLIPKSLVEDIGGYDESLLADQDGDFVQRLLWKRPKVVYEQSAFFLYRQHSETNRISAQHSLEKLESRYKVYCKLRSMVEKAGMLEKYRKPLSKKLLRVAISSIEVDNAEFTSLYKEAQALDPKLRLHHRPLVHWILKIIGLMNGYKIIKMIKNKTLGL